MLGKLPDLNPKDYGMEHSAAELHALTNLPLDVCMSIMTEMDDLPCARTLIYALKNDVKSTQLLAVYQALSQVEMMR